MLTQQQLKDRLSVVTGSDAAAIAGLSPYKTAMQLWMEKTQRVEQEDISELNHIKFGNYMESGVADWFAAESGREILQHEEMLIHSEHKWMAGNIDFKIKGENAILECKTAYNDEGWGGGVNLHREPTNEENRIPPHYLMQVAHYCAVGAFDRAYIAVVFTTTREMRWYRYDRNSTLEEKLIKLESDFWHNHVLTDVMPEPKNENDIKAMFKEARFDPCYATAEDEALVYKYKALSDLIGEYEEKLQLLRDELCLKMQNHETLVAADGTQLISWKFTKAAARFDAKKFETDRPELYKYYMKESAPSRRFCVKVKGEK